MTAGREHTFSVRNANIRRRASMPTRDPRSLSAAREQALGRGQAKECEPPPA
jgi:hypothetical protein